ncbi:substrate-binding periplasmic protein [Dongshaea marina]|uniref:substrate-binding periplasmic protein n=1 Tax=Dongshaea marina TaxID=2047966 RepID=UPI000D3EDDBE|nr:transporter substrate-binding domain-containing protein [Dongshaea marina]
MLHRLILLTLLLVKSSLLFAGNLTILTEQWPPMNFSEKGKLKGLAVEVVQAIQKKLGDDTQIQMMTWRSAYERATTQPNVLLFSTSKSEKRLPLFTFVGPLAIGKLNLYALKNSPYEVDSIKKAKNVKRIGVYYSSVGEQKLFDLGFKNIVSVRSLEKAGRLLIKGRVDLWCNTNISYRQILDKLGFPEDEVVSRLTLDQSNLYLAFSKGTDPKTIAHWREAFRMLHRDGTFKTIYQRWLPGEQPPKRLNR